MVTPLQSRQELGAQAAAALFGRGGASKAELQAIKFNGAVEPAALGIVRPLDEEALQHAMAIASREQVQVSVVGGGHDMAGRAFQAENLIIDMSALKSIAFDAASGEMTLGGGVVSGELIDALPDDRAAIIGGCLTVGMAGFAMAGGYGPLTARFGLMCDNVRSARVVLADGSVAIASESEDRDLLWAIRGGGSGFGVVTSMTIATHELPRVLKSVIMVGIEGAADALRAVQRAIDREPVDLSVVMAFMRGPDGSPGLMVSALWTDGLDRGEAIIDQITAEIGGSVVARVWSPYKKIFDPEAEKLYPKGDSYHLVSRNVRRLEDGVIGSIVATARKLPGDKDFMVIHDFHGAASGVAPAATAFALRQDHFMIEVTGHWTDGDGTPHRRWAEDGAAAIGDRGMPGGYPALMSPGEADRTAAFYGANADRLIGIKRRLDPRDALRSAMGRIESRQSTIG